MKRPDLLLLVAIWEFISAFLCLIGLLAIVIFAIVHTALSLFSFPVGTMLGVLVIIYMTRTKVRDYFWGTMSS